jgi:hypothetical protein
MKALALKLLALGLVAWLLGACASQGVPTGGPKDEAPPKLLSTVPRDQSTDYRGRQVQVVFDEYLDLKNIKQELTITPALRGDFQYKLKKGSILTIEFDSALLDSTTYVLDFGEAIRDANERNPAQNIRLAFSTGPVIDTFSVQGQVRELLTHKLEIKTVVALYREKDTIDIDKGKPLYYTRTDSSGNYVINNIRAGRYKLYALREGKTSNLTYDNNAEWVAFDTAIVDLARQPSQARNLFTTQYDIKSFRFATARALRNYFEVKATKGIYDLEVTIPDSAFAAKVAYQTDKDVVRFYNIDKKLKPTDSTTVYLTAKDSTGNVALDTVIVKFNEPKPGRVAKTDAQELPKSVDKVRPEFLAEVNFRFSFTKPILDFRPDSIRFKIDKDTVAQALAASSFAWNPSRTELVISQKTKAKSKVDFTFKKGTFISVEKDSVDEKKLTYQARPAEEAGGVSGEVRTPHPNFIVQLTSARLFVEAEKPNAKKFSFDYLTPGDKRIRIVIDVNGNGKWDNGDFKKRVPPEPVYIYGGKLPVKPNWLLEDEVVDTTEPEEYPEVEEQRAKEAAKQKVRR